MAAWFRKVWLTLSTPEHAARYLATALVADLALSLTLIAMVSLLPGQQNPTFPGVSLARIALVMGLAVPVIETACLAIVLEIIRKLVRPTVAAASIAALVAAGLHSWAQPLWGPLVAWTFFLQAYCYLTWRPKSLATAAGLTLALHALHNGAAVLLLAAQRTFTLP